MRQAYDYWQNQPGNYPWAPAGARGHKPPRREAGVSVTVQVWATTWIAPSRGLRTLQRSPLAARPIRLPPLSSPEDSPRRGEYRARRPPTFAACVPRVEEARGGSSLFTGRYLPGLAPEAPAWRIVAICQQSTGLWGAYCRKTVGLQFSSPRPGAADASADRLLIRAFTHLNERLRLDPNPWRLADKSWRNRQPPGTRIMLSGNPSAKAHCPKGRVPASGKSVFRARGVRYHLGALQPLPPLWGSSKVFRLDWDFSTSPHRFGEPQTIRRWPRAANRSEKNWTTGFLYGKTRSPAQSHTSGSRRRAGRPILLTSSWNFYREKVVYHL